MTTFASTRALAKVAGRDKITIDGVDVSNFRGYHTPPPRYLLMEPFAYGATSVQFPQVHATFEESTFGTGDLSWVREGARVVMSRTFDTDPEAVDYVGVVTAVEVYGRVLNLTIGGEFTGRASLIDMKNQPYRVPADVGHLAAVVMWTVNMNIDPWFGPVTGIQLAQVGEQTLLSWAQYLCTMSQDATGAQRALMPQAWGSPTWEFEPKDTTTRHLTAFPDDARVVLQVADDAAEQPNVWYGTGVDLEGIRWRNAKWPGVFQGTPDAYPIAGGAPFGLGTVDADTIDGDGITVLQINLQQRGYMPFTIASSGTYTADFVAAVKLLQADAGQAATGTMTTGAWNALFDLDVTGYDVNGNVIFPLVTDPRVEPRLYSATGQVIGINPSFDPTVLRVERSVDFGPGVDKAYARAWCTGQYARAQGKNWTGTIEFNRAGAFWGDHANEATVTEADLASYRDIRPGMNVWVPYFDGGTLFHISGVDVSDGRAVATVDTQARDLMEVREIIERNQSSRRDTRRAWILQQQAQKASGNMIMADENFGVLSRNVALTGNEWNVFPVVAGQHGQVNKVDLQTFADQAEFAVAIFAKKVTPNRLQNRIGNPLVEADESVWETGDLEDWWEDSILLYAAGDGAQPCGYGRRRKVNDVGNPTGAPITGRYIDRATWPYVFAAGTKVLLYVAIYPDRNCALRRGRILWAQLDDMV